MCFFGNQKSISTIKLAIVASLFFVVFYNVLLSFHYGVSNFLKRYSFLDVFGNRLGSSHLLFHFSHLVKIHHQGIVDFFIFNIICFCLFYGSP